MKEELAKACRSVAADIRSGPLKPGKWFYMVDGEPCCAIGHVCHRVSVSVRDAQTLFWRDDALHKAWREATATNDTDGDTPTTLEALAGLLEESCEN